jgi:hypothetical protein
MLGRMCSITCGLSEVCPDRSAKDVVVVLPTFANFELGCKSITAVLFQRYKSKYGDVDIVCSGGKQGQSMNGVIAITITGTI